VRELDVADDAHGRNGRVVFAANARRNSSAKSSAIERVAAVVTVRHRRRASRCWTRKLVRITTTHPGLETGWAPGALQIRA